MFVDIFLFKFIPLGQNGTSYTRGQFNPELEKGSVILPTVLETGGTRGKGTVTIVGRK